MTTETYEAEVVGANGTKNGESIKPGRRRIVQVTFRNVIPRINLDEESALTVIREAVEHTLQGHMHIKDVRRVRKVGGPHAP